MIKHESYFNLHANIAVKLKNTKQYEKFANAEILKYINRFILLNIFIKNILFPYYDRSIIEYLRV